MEKEKSPKKESQDDFNAIKEMLEFDFYNFHIKRLANKIKSETCGVKLKSINY